MSNNITTDNKGNLPTSPIGGSKTDTNPTESLTDPSSDSGLPQKPTQEHHQNLADVILEALEDEVQHNKQSHKSASSSSNNSSLRNESVASKMLGKKPTSSQNSPTSAKSPSAPETPKEEEDAPPVPSQPRKHDSPVQKYSPLITAAPGTHDQPPGTAMGVPPKQEKQHSEKAHHLDGTTDSVRDTETSGTKHGPAKKTAGPHHHDILNKLDPRVDSDRDGSRVVGGHGGRKVEGRRGIEVVE